MAALTGWPTITDDVGTKRDGTIINQALFNSVKASIEAEVLSATNPSVTTKAIIDEVVAARGTMASIDARLDVAMNEDGTLKGSSQFSYQAGKGLVLRTHPDQDKALSQVMLVNADELILADGGGNPVQTTGWSLVTADITTTGAGGLDTGSEGASRWYEIHAIRKSGDGTKSLLLHRAKDFASGANQGTSGGSTALRDAAARTKLAQSFQTTVAGKCEFVDMFISKNTAPTGNFWVTLEADAAGSPSGTPLATSDKMNVAGLVAGSNIYVRMPFRTPVTLAGSTTYHLVLQADFTVSGTNYMSWGHNPAGGYASGSVKQFDGATWSAIATIDMVFAVWITQNDTSVTMPTGYDQRALIGYVYNGAGSNFTRFVQYGRRVKPLDGTQFCAAASHTTKVLYTPLALIPFIPVKVWFVGWSALYAAIQLAGVPNGFEAAGTVGDGGCAMMGCTGSQEWSQTDVVLTECSGVYVFASASTQTIHIMSWEF
jgi:hypothetical protein